MELYLNPRQTRDGEPGSYEARLAQGIEKVFGTGTHDLPGLVAGLNGEGLFAPDGQAWTEKSFTAEMKRLGA
jgi:hypothetical protein